MTDSIEKIITSYRSNIARPIIDRLEALLRDNVVVPKSVWKKISEAAPVCVSTHRAKDGK